MKSPVHENKALELRDRGALFVLNHSGGKDSQCMTIILREMIPDEQLVVIYADLDEVVWGDEVQHIEDTVGDLPIIVAVPHTDFFAMVDRRHEKLQAAGKGASPWPSPALRQCTSDLKRTPIEREVRRYIKAQSLSGLVVNCMGMRAEESHSRAKAKTWKFNKRNSKAGREWYDWLPIHGFLEGEVFGTIRDAGEEPHWVYEAGMSRSSCCFCIMANRSDLRCAAGLRSKLYRRYVDLEKGYGYTINMARIPLEDYTGVDASE